MKETAVFVTNELPMPNMAGHLAYNYEVVRFLEREGYVVHIVLLKPRMRHLITKIPALMESTLIMGPGLLCIAGWCATILPAPLFKTIARDILVAFPREVVRWVKNYIRTSSNKRRTILGTFISEQDIAYTIDILRDIKPAVIFADTIFRASIFSTNFLGSHRIIVTHDVFFNRVESLRQRGFIVEPYINASLETKMLSQADALIVSKDEDQRILGRMLPSTTVVTVGYPVRPAQVRVAARVPGRCIFVGSHSPHNLDGLEWLLGDIWPKVVSALPDAELHVYGTVCDGVSRTGVGVIFHGWAANLAAGYLSSSAAVVPLRAGSGVKIKLVESLAHGLPCVVTSVAAEGFEPGPDAPFLVADDPDDYARALCRVLADGALHSALSDRAYRYAERFSEANVFRALKAHLDAARRAAMPDGTS